MAYSCPFTTVSANVSDFTGSVELPDVLSGLWPAGAWQNGPTWWYPLTAQIPYHETGDGDSTIPGSQGFRVTRRIRVTRIKGRLYLRLGYSDCALRIVIGQFKKPALAWTVGGPGYFPDIDDSLAFYGVPGTNWTSGSSPYIFCGINNAWYGQRTPGLKSTFGAGTAGWPVVLTTETGDSKTESSYEPAAIPGPFNTVLAWNDGQAAPAVHQMRNNIWWGQQFSFCGGAGRDFSVKWSASANTLNALTDEDIDAGGNKRYQVVDIDIDCSGCPESVFEEYVDFETIGALTNNAPTGSGGNEVFGNVGIPTENALCSFVDPISQLPFGEMAEWVASNPVKTAEASGFWTDAMYKNHWFLGFSMMRAGTIDRGATNVQACNWGGSIVVDYESVYDDAHRTVSFERGAAGLNTRS